jgi:hypothetical protein
MLVNSTVLWIHVGCKILISISVMILLIACNSPSVRNNKADTLAISGEFSKEIINTSHFQILSYQKITERNQSVSIYIEGDGLAFLDRYQVSLNPTPINPVSLRLAILDMLPNVVYIARPCQYIPMENNPKCDTEYWTIKRYAPEVIASINEAIDIINKNNRLEGIRLVGYSGGGTVAAILAATRNDVIDLRTVAGNLDTNAFAQVHNASPLSGSLNPIDYVDQLKDIPQIHFIGSDDDIVPAEVVNSYISEVKKVDSGLHCIFTQTFPDVSHTDGWESVWKQNLRREIRCND